MDLKHCRPALSALAAAGTLLLLGCTLSMPASRSATLTPDAGLSGETGEADLPQKTRRHARRVRTSLSLPYFSFARPLNPRS
ncbi:MAG: hypothetical protein WA956_04165 [Stenotrophomonas sp.]